MARYMDNTAAMGTNLLAAARLAALGQMADGLAYRNVPYSPQVPAAMVRAPRRQRNRLADLLTDTMASVPAQDVTMGQRPAIGRFVGQMTGTGRALPITGRVGRKMPASRMAPGPSDVAMNRLREILMQSPTRGLGR